MAEKDPAKPEVGAAGKARRVAEEERLAAALRANLARRKRQTRERAATDAEPDRKAD